LHLTVLILRANDFWYLRANGASSFSAGKGWLALFFRLACANTLLMIPTDHVTEVKWAAGSNSYWNLAGHDEYLHVH